MIQTAKLLILPKFLTFYETRRRITISSGKSPSFGPTRYGQPFLGLRQLQLHPKWMCWWLWTKVHRTYSACQRTLLIHFARLNYWSTTMLTSGKMTPLAFESLLAVIYFSNWLTQIIALSAWVQNWTTRWFSMGSCFTQRFPNSIKLCHQSKLSKAFLSTEFSKLRCFV